MPPAGAHVQGESSEKTSNGNSASNNKRPSISGTNDTGYISDINLSDISSKHNTKVADAAGSFKSNSQTPALRVTGTTSGSESHVQSPANRGRGTAGSSKSQVQTPVNQVTNTASSSRINAMTSVNQVASTASSSRINGMTPCQSSLLLSDSDDDIPLLTRKTPNSNNQSIKRIHSTHATSSGTTFYI